MPSNGNEWRMLTYFPLASFGDRRWIELWLKYWRHGSFLESSLLSREVKSPFEHWPSKVNRANCKRTCWVKFSTMQPYKVQPLSSKCWFSRAAVQRSTSQIILFITASKHRTPTSSHFQKVLKLSRFWMCNDEGLRAIYLLWPLFYASIEMRWGSDVISVSSRCHWLTRQPAMDKKFMDKNKALRDVQNIKGLVSRLSVQYNTIDFI